MSKSYSKSVSDQSFANSTAADVSISEADVKTYLQSHPDFFRNNATLLGDLSLPHVSGNAVSLVEKQVAVLRDRSIKTRRKLGELMDNAEENNSLFAKTQQLILQLLQAQSSEELLSTVEKAFVNDFDVEHCAILLLLKESLPTDAPIAQRTKLIDEARLSLGNIIDDSSTFCGALRPEEAHYVFALNTRNETAPSSAIATRTVSLPEQDSNAYTLLIAVGHSDGNHYNQDTGTLFIDYIADVLQILLGRLLPGN